MIFLRSTFVRCALSAALLAASAPTFADGFVATASMHQARFGHTATLLQNGKVLVVAGGSIDDLFASAELYDPTANTWTTTGSLHTAREYHTATLLTSGKVLVVGGSAFGVPLQSAEIYDPNTGVWSQAGTPTSKRVAHTATLLASGSVLVAFGTTANNGATPTSSAELYNPSTNSWAATGSAPGAYARSYAQAAFVSSGAYVAQFGGADGTDAPLGNGISYNIATGSWVGPFAVMTTARYLFATGIVDTVPYVIGGYTASGPTATVEYYDPSNHWLSAKAMNTKRYSHTATVIDADGDILVTGGVTTDTSLASAEIYSPSFNIWTPTSNTMSVGRSQHTATLLGYGRVLVCGGQTGTGNNAVETTSCDRYIVDPIYHNGFDLIPD